MDYKQAKKETLRDIPDIELLNKKCQLAEELEMVMEEISRRANAWIKVVSTKPSTTE